MADGGLMACGGCGSRWSGGSGWGAVPGSLLQDSECAVPEATGVGTGTGTGSEELIAGW